MHKTWIYFIFIKSNCFNKILEKRLSIENRYIANNCLKYFTFLIKKLVFINRVFSKFKYLSSKLIKKIKINLN